MNRGGGRSLPACIGHPPPGRLSPSRDEHTLVFVSGLWLLAAGCSLALAQTPAGGPPGFRVRSDFAAGLNTDQGWAGALNENVTLPADRPFRLRFEVETAFTSNQRFGLQYRRNGGDWLLVEAHAFPKPEDIGDREAKTPPVSIVACPAYQNGATTTNVLHGTTSVFQPGSGVSLTANATPQSAAEGHSEFEWALVIRRFADRALTNEEGDMFEFRMTDDAGASVTPRLPALRLSIPPGHLGGTFVETPGRIGPWQAANGDLYFVMEPAETDNLFMMVKSTDGGRTWREVDGAHRPASRDLESVEGRQIGDTIHLIHQVTRAVRYHSFRTSDHPTHPDTWHIRDEKAAAPVSVAQAATLVVRSDGSLVTFCTGSTIHYAVRSSAGQWSAETIIDRGTPPDLSGPKAELGANDTVHLAYYGMDGTIWYRRLLRGGTLTPRQQLASGVGTTRAEFGAVLPLVFIPRTNTVVIIYQQADGKLWERRIVNDGPPSAPVLVADRAVVRNAVDSQQPGADAVLHDETVHVLFIDAADRSLYSTHDRGGWQPPALQVGDILGSWVRGGVYRRKDGVNVYGYVYDAGSLGGSGMNRFGELPLR